MVSAALQAVLTAEGGSEMTSTLPLILAEEPVTRSMLTRTKVSRPNIAVVYADAFGQVAYFGGRPLSWARAASPGTGSVRGRSQRPPAHGAAGQLAAAGAWRLLLLPQRGRRRLPGHRPRGGGQAQRHRCARRRLQLPDRLPSGRSPAVTRSRTPQVPRPSSTPCSSSRSP